jgi:short-subunit dehydrogenase
LNPDDRPTVLLTGAAHGIGRATATALASRGYRVGLIDRDEGPLIKLAGGLGPGVAAEAADVRGREALGRAVTSLEKKLGPTGVLIACAGVGGLSSVLDLDTAGLRAMLEVNVLGVAHTIEAALPGMIERRAGHIVGVSSVAGYRGLPWMPGYSASKAALTTYLEGLRPPLKLRGITITTAYPGFVRTALTADTPFRRPVKMLEPAEAARYLVRAVERRPRDLVFPASAAIGMGFLRRLPAVVFDWMMDRAGPRALSAEY